nr:unnamed protein product [Callosobruchus chinensis]
MVALLQKLPCQKTQNDNGNVSAIFIYKWKGEELVLQFPAITNWNLFVTALSSIMAKSISNASRANLKLDDLLNFPIVKNIVVFSSRSGTILCILIPGSFQSPMSIEGYNTFGGFDNDG